MNHEIEHRLLLDFDEVEMVLDMAELLNVTPEEVAETIKRSRVTRRVRKATGKSPAKLFIVVPKIEIDLER